MFANTSTRQTAAAFAGSIIMTATCFAAVSIASPAQADPGFKQTVEQQIETTLRTPMTRRELTGVSTIAVRIDGRGEVVDASVVGTSGHALLDGEALRTAKAVRYPAGQARTVAVVLRFGNVPMPATSTSQALLRRHTVQALAAGDTATTG